MTSIYVFPTFSSTLKWTNFTPQKQPVQNSEDFKTFKPFLEEKYLSNETYQQGTFLFQWQPTDFPLLKTFFPSSYENCIASNNVDLELVMWNLKDATEKLNKLPGINGNDEKGDCLQNIFQAIQKINTSKWWKDENHYPVKENVILSWADIKKKPDLKLKAKIPWLICPELNQFLLCWLHAQLLKCYFKANPKETLTIEGSLENELSIYLVLERVRELEKNSDALPEKFKHALNNEILHHLCTVYIWYSAFIKKQPGNNAAHALPFLSTASKHVLIEGIKPTLSPRILSDEFCTKINSEHKKLRDETIFCGYKAVETICIDTIQKYAATNEMIQRNISIDFLNNTLLTHIFVQKKQKLLY
jgi:hypothetical protein